MENKFQFHKLKISKGARITLSVLMIFSAFAIQFAPPPKTAVAAGCTTSFAPEQTPILTGSSTYIDWATSGCTNVYFAGTDKLCTTQIDASSSGSWQTPSLTSNKTYYLFADGSCSSATVFVASGPSCAIQSFSASPPSVNSGGYTTLNWTTANCSSVSIGPGIGSVPTSGSQSVGPISSQTTYTLTADGSATSNVTVTINSGSACVINTFTASPTSVPSGSSSTFTWTSSNCGSTPGALELYGPICSPVSCPSSLNSVVEPVNGSTTIGSVVQQMTYYLEGPGQSSPPAAAQVTIYPAACTINSFNNVLNSNNTVTLNWDTSSCTNWTLSGGEYGSGVALSSGQGSVTTAAPISSNTTFTLNAFKQGGNSAAPANTTAILPASPTCSIVITRPVNGGQASGATLAGNPSWNLSGKVQQSGTVDTTLYNMPLGSYNLVSSTGSTGIINYSGSTYNSAITAASGSCFTAGQTLFLTMPYQTLPILKVQ